MKVKESKEEFNPSKFTFSHGFSFALLLVSIILATVAYVKWDINYLNFSLFVFLFMSGIVRGLQIKIQGELIQHMAGTIDKGFHAVGEVLEEHEKAVRR